MGTLGRIVRNLSSADSAAISGPLVERSPASLRPLVETLLWKENPAPRGLGGDSRCRLHLGCGTNLLPGFVNIDFLPESKSVLGWNVLDRWPDELVGKVSHAFSEDMLEHFFFDEQVYILSQMNRALEPGGVFRVLMPSLDSLLRVGRDFVLEKDRDSFLAKNFGVQSGADAVNLGMRFGGHRWLHDHESFARLARHCGFEATATTCRESTVAELCDLNIRGEDDSLSFAHDLVKVRALAHWQIEASHVVGARKVDELAPGQPLYRADNDDPQIRYELPASLSSDRIVSMAFRGANLSQLHEHNFAEAYLVQEPGKALAIDASLRSTPHTSMVSAPLIAAKVGCAEIDLVRFDPARHRGDVFSVGPLELFFHPRDA